MGEIQMSKISSIAATVTFSLVMSLFVLPANAGRRAKIPGIIPAIGGALIYKAIQDSQKKQRQRIRQNRRHSNERPVAYRPSRGRAPRSASTRRAVQERLSDFGFYDGDIDGKFGRGTRRAIARYQRSIGARPTGRLTANQVELLLPGRDAASTKLGSRKEKSAARSGQSGVVQFTAGASGSNSRQHRTGAPIGANDFAGIPENVVKNARAIQNALPNLRIHKGAIVVAESVDTAILPEQQVSQSDFADYLVLLAKPSRIKEIETAALYGNLMLGNKSRYFKMTREEVWNYIRQNIWSRRLNQKSFNRVDGIRGEDEFEKQDNLDAFIKAHANKILARRPKFPFDILDIRPVQLKDYDSDARAYSWKIRGSNSLLRLPGPSKARIEGSLPFKWPENWKLPLQQAKALVQRRYKRLIKKSGSYAVKSLVLSRAKRLIIATRVRARGIRWDGRKAILDVAAVSLAVYSDVSLRKKLADIPLPEDAILAEPKNAVLAQSAGSKNVVRSKIRSDKVEVRSGGPTPFTKSGKPERSAPGIAVPSGKKYNFERAMNSILPGLRFYNGAVVDNRTGHNADVSPANQIALNDFADYLVLVAQPDRIRNTKTAAWYGNLMTGKKSRFFNISTVREFGLGGWKSFRRADGIRGDDEFEKQENIASFIKLHADRILDRRPKLPFDIIHLYSVDLKKYDRAAGGFPLKIDGGRFSSSMKPKQTALEEPVPFRAPRLWKLPRQRAKIVLRAHKQEIKRRGRGEPRRLILGSRVRVRGIRWEGYTATLDVAAVSLALYSDATLKKKLADLPLPKDAIRAEPKIDTRKVKPGSIFGSGGASSFSRTTPLEIAAPASKNCITGTQTRNKEERQRGAPQTHTGLQSARPRNSLGRIYRNP